MSPDTEAKILAGVEQISRDQAQTRADVSELRRMVTDLSRTIDSHGETAGLAEDMRETKRDRIAIKAEMERDRAAHKADRAEIWEAFEEAKAISIAEREKLKADVHALQIAPGRVALSTAEKVVTGVVIFLSVSLLGLVGAQIYHPAPVAVERMPR